MTAITEAIDTIVRHAESYEEAVQQILEEFVVIPHSELPEVEDIGTHLALGAKVFIASDSAREREFALDHLALSLFLEAKESAASAAEVKRNARRSALSLELFNNAAWHTLNEGATRAIDRIIELEEAAA